MRLPLSDKFLFDLYNFLEKAGDVYDIFSARPWREVWNPEFHKFRYEAQKRYARKNFNQFIYYLKKRGYIKIENLKQKQAVLLTQKGADKILKIKLKTKEKKKRADGKWQMLIFDIPETKRRLRDLLRDSLRFLGYEMLQKSIWVCPNDIFKETEILLRKYSLDQYVKLFLIEEIEL